MSNFSYLGAFATLAAYQRLGGHEAATDGDSKFSHHPSSSHSQNDHPPNHPSPPLQLAKHLISLTLSATIGGYIVGNHGHLAPSEHQTTTTSPVPETISMLWLSGTSVIALFGAGKMRVPGIGLLFTTAWNDMIDWLHEQAEDGEE